MAWSLDSASGFSLRFVAMSPRPPSRGPRGNIPAAWHGGERRAFSARIPRCLQTCRALARRPAAAWSWPASPGAGRDRDWDHARAVDRLVAARRQRHHRQRGLLRHPGARGAPRPRFPLTPPLRPMGEPGSSRLSTPRCWRSRCACWAPTRWRSAGRRWPWRRWIAVSLAALVAPVGRRVRRRRAPRLCS